MDDLIKRQDAINSIESHIRTGDELYPITETDKILNHAFEISASCIYNMPSADPKQKTGKWIECSASEHWKCSECGCRASYWFNEENSSSYDLDMSEWLSDYCPNCGARNGGVG